MTGEKEEWKWTEEEQNSFEKLKAALISAPMLSFPHLEWPTILDTDASADGFGAILMQKDPEGRERVLAYASRVTNPGERKWCASELEAAAIIWALEKFRPYLIDIPFKCRTDHSSLKWIRQSHTGRLVRWALKLDEYDMTIETRPGIRMPHVDALSRYPIQALEDGSMEVNLEDRYDASKDGDEQEVLETIPRLQRQDAECQMLYQALTRGTKVYSHLQRYITSENLYIDGKLIMFKNRERNVPYVPVCLRARLIKEYHEGGCAAHLGSKKILGALKKKYF